MPTDFSGFLREQSTEVQLIFNTPLLATVIALFRSLKNQDNGHLKEENIDHAVWATKDQLADTEMKPLHKYLMTLKQVQDIVDDAKSPYQVICLMQEEKPVREITVLIQLRTKPSIVPNRMQLIDAMRSSGECYGHTYNIYSGYCEEITLTWS